MTKRSFASLRMKAAMTVALYTSLFLIRCAEEPGVGEGYEKPAFTHALVGDDADDCSSCHTDVRPAPREEHPHGGGKQCSTCHTPKDDNSGWLPRIAYSHDPKPDSCMDCHVQDRPTLASHPKTGDCVACHNYPRFK